MGSEECLVHQKHFREHLPPPGSQPLETEMRLEVPSPTPEITEPL